MSGSRVAQISVPSDSHSIAIARRFVSQILADLAWVTPAMVDDVRLVASELVTNAVRAQRRVDDSATIAIRAAGFDDRFELTVVDHGGVSLHVEHAATLDPRVGGRARVGGRRRRGRRHGLAGPRQ